MGRVRDYEIVLILSPALDETQTAGTVDRLHNLITERGGSVTLHESWGMRRLSYPIRSFREGNYSLTQFTMDGDHSKEISVALNLSEDVLRHLLVKAEAGPPGRPSAPPVARPIPAPSPTAPESPPSVPEASVEESASSVPEASVEESASSVPETSVEESASAVPEASIEESAPAETETSEEPER